MFQQNSRGILTANFYFEHRVAKDGSDMFKVFSRQSATYGDLHPISCGSITNERGKLTLWLHTDGIDEDLAQGEFLQAFEIETLDELTSELIAGKIQDLGTLLDQEEVTDRKLQMR